MLGKKRQAARDLKHARLKIVEIFPGTREAELMQTLARRPSGRDQNEAASIAVAASDPALLLVTGDNKAAVWALNELFHSGEPVMRVPVFVRTLFERGAIDGAVLKAVADRAASHGVAPSWWRSWIVDRC